MSIIPAQIFGNPVNTRFDEKSAKLSIFEAHDSYGLQAWAGIAAKTPLFKFLKNQYIMNFKNIYQNNL